MEYPEFRDLVKSWELPEEWAERMWGRFGHVLMHVTAADVELAFRDAITAIQSEAQHDVN